MPQGRSQWALTWIGAANKRENMWWVPSTRVRGVETNLPGSVISRDE
jgi:hypothetical protein